MKDREERLRELSAHFDTIAEYSEKDGVRTDFVLALQIYAVKRWGCFEQTARDYARTVCLQKGIPFEQIQNHAIHPNISHPKLRAISAPAIQAVNP